MKGNKKLIDKLNSLLADELTAINEYMVHSEMRNQWGYARLHDSMEKQAIDEMKHAEMLINRIIFLEGRPVVSTLREIKIGQDVPAQLRNDVNLEYGAVKAYNDAIILAGEVRDFATREILEKILMDEDRHVDTLEEQIDQVEQLGIQIFLGHQIKKEG